MNPAAPLPIEPAAVGVAIVASPVPGPAVAPLLAAPDAYEAEVDPAPAPALASAPSPVEPSVEQAAAAMEPGVEAAGAAEAGVAEIDADRDRDEEPGVRREDYDVPDRKEEPGFSDRDKESDA